MYQPSQELLKKYSDVLIKFALGSGEGIKKGDVVYLTISESAKPFLLPLQQSILEAGGHMILRYLPEGTMRSFFENASKEQIEYWPKEYMLSLVDTMTHVVFIDSTWDKYDLKGVDGQKIIARQSAAKFYMDARNAKENRGELTWTIGLYGTEQMAEDVGMTPEEYWQEIIKACFLDEEDPIAKWKEVFAQMEDIRSKISNLPIDKIHVIGEDADLWITLGEQRKWLAGGGRNIPSFEVFTSPDWRGTNGWIRFNQQLFSYGNLIEGIRLEFKDGVIINSSATKGEDLLKEMIKAKNADKVGEFSLTDRRFSRITCFMGETLYDENVGGEFGNTHIAIGNSYQDTFTGDVSAQSEEDWARLGYNDSPIHTDIMSTTNRTVFAQLKDGTKILIYKDGEFKI